MRAAPGHACRNPEWQAMVARMWADRDTERLEAHYRLVALLVDGDRMAAWSRIYTRRDTALLQVRRCK